MTPPEAETRQLRLDLGWRRAEGRADFRVSAANEEAVLWIDRWPDWPAPALVLEGPSGAGKSHLAGVWRTRAGAQIVEGPALDASFVETLAREPVAIVVEQADHAPEQALFHLYNILAEHAASLLLTAERRPARWESTLPDLASRLRALPVATIQAPDDALIREVLSKQLADRGILAPPAVLDFILPRIERSFAAVRRLAVSIDRACADDRRSLSIPLVRSLVENLASPSEGDRPST